MRVKIYLVCTIFLMVGCAQYEGSYNAQPILKVSPWDDPVPMSVAKAWGNYQNLKTFESFADLHYLCAGKTLYFSGSQEGWVPYWDEYSAANIKDDVIRHDKRIDVYAVGVDKAEKAMSDRVSSVIETEMDYVLSLRHPRQSDADWCARNDSCMNSVMKINAFYPDLEAQAKQCVEIARWYREQN
jgi:hypothetical protein